jgi:hypothetical protein
MLTLLALALPRAQILDLPLLGMGLLSYQMGALATADRAPAILIRAELGVGLLTLWLHLLAWVKRGSNRPEQPALIVEPARDLIREV